MKVSVKPPKVRAWPAVLITALCAFSAAPGIINTVSFRLAWAAPAEAGLTNYVEGTNFAFNLWGTTNLGVGLSNYPKMTCVTNWSLGPVNPDGSQWHTSGVFTLSAAQYFVYVTLTNGNGEAGPSNVAQNGPVPTMLTNLVMQR